MHAGLVSTAVYKITAASGLTVNNPKYLQLLVWSTEHTVLHNTLRDYGSWTSGGLGTHSKVKHITLVHGKNSMYCKS